MNSDQASKVIEEYHSNDPFIIAEKMDINVFTRPLVDIGGYYMVLKNNVKIAVIDSGLSRHLQRFVLFTVIVPSVSMLRYCGFASSSDSPSSTVCTSIADGSVGTYTP